MKKHLLWLILLCAGHVGFCQQTGDNSQIQTALKVRALVEKKADYHKKTNGEYEGYRIKIHFSADRSAANAVKTKFLAKYSDIAAYDDYLQPNFVIMVGDFKTKLEAFETLKKIQVDFPNAFIIKSKIRPMKIG
ncbi:MAG: SPOR domain-containing protein [Bacteroidetes bacterium]|nr:SPOR domain-containing protein [Bacteroidota bacterium]